MKEKRNQRSLPANVDGRLKVGPFTIKNFLKWIWIPIVLIIFFFLDPSQKRFFLALFVSSVTSVPFMEFRYRQSGVDFFKELIVYDLRTLLANYFPKYFRHIEIRFERSDNNDSVLEKFTLNEKVIEVNKKIRQRKSES
jgi:hypothetical protein